MIPSLAGMELLAEGPNLGWLSFLLKGVELHSQDSPHDFELAHMGVGPTHSTFLPLLPVSTWLFLNDGCFLVKL